MYTRTSMLLLDEDYKYRKYNICTRLISFIYSETYHHMHVSIMMQVNTIISVIFLIVSNIYSARNFVELIGAHRFDNILSGDTEESKHSLI